MRRESRGEEWLVSCCGDGDVVDVVDGDGSGFGEGRKGEKKEGGGRLGCEFANASKRVVPHVECKVTLHQGRLAACIGDVCLVRRARAVGSELMPELDHRPTRPDATKQRARRCHLFFYITLFLILMDMSLSTVQAAHAEPSPTLLSSLSPSPAVGRVTADIPLYLPAPLYVLISRRYLGSIFPLFRLRTHARTGIV